MSLPVQQAQAVKEKVLHVWLDVDDTLVILGKDGNSWVLNQPLVNALLTFEAQQKLLGVRVEFGIATQRCLCKANMDYGNDIHGVKFLSNLLTRLRAHISIPAERVCMSMDAVYGKGAGKYYEDHYKDIEQTLSAAPENLKELKESAHTTDMNLMLDKLSVEERERFAAASMPGFKAKIDAEWGLRARFLGKKDDLVQFVSGNAKPSHTSVFIDDGVGEFDARADDKVYDLSLYTNDPSKAFIDPRSGMMRSGKTPYKDKAAMLKLLSDVAEKQFPEQVILKPLYLAAQPRATNRELELSQEARQNAFHEAFSVIANNLQNARNGDRSVHFSALISFICSPSNDQFLYDNLEQFKILFDSCLKFKKIRVMLLNTLVSLGFDKEVDVFLKLYQNGCKGSRYTDQLASYQQVLKHAQGQFNLALETWNNYRANATFTPKKAYPSANYLCTLSDYKLVSDSLKASRQKLSELLDIGMYLQSRDVAKNTFSGIDFNTLKSDMEQKNPGMLSMIPVVIKSTVNSFLASIRQLASLRSPMKKSANIDAFQKVALSTAQDLEESDFVPVDSVNQQVALLRLNTPVIDTKALTNAAYSVWQPQLVIAGPAVATNTVNGSLNSSRSSFFAQLTALVPQLGHGNKKDDVPVPLRSAIF